MAKMTQQELKMQQEAIKLSKERRNLDVEHMKTLSKIGGMYGKQEKATSQQQKHMEALSKIQKDLYKDVKGQNEQVLKRLAHDYKIEKVEERLLNIH